MLFLLRQKLQVQLYVHPYKIWEMLQVQPLEYNSESSGWGHLDGKLICALHGCT
jgi:hypothetical protein